jgi:hypothetical protein
MSSRILRRLERCYKKSLMEDDDYITNGELFDIANILFLTKEVLGTN